MGIRKDTLYVSAAATSVTGAPIAKACHQGAPVRTNSLGLTERDLALFGDSYERCRRHGHFLDRFYDRLLSSSAEVADLFAHTDFRRQKASLAAALYAMMSFARRNPAPPPELERIAQKHSRQGHNIRPELYGLWQDALLATVRECDAKFDADSERAWRRIIGASTDFMLARY